MAVKKNIEDIQGKDNYPCGQQLLIHNGKVLKDESTLTENKVSEDGFLVVMLSKVASFFRLRLCVIFTSRILYLPANTGSVCHDYMYWLELFKVSLLVILIHLFSSSKIACIVSWDTDMLDFISNDTLIFSYFSILLLYSLLYGQSKTSGSSGTTSTQVFLFAMSIIIVVIVICYLISCDPKPEHHLWTRANSLHP